MSEGRLTKLRRMLKARMLGGEARPEFRESVPKIKDEIARLEAQLAPGNPDE